MVNTTTGYFTRAKHINFLLRTCVTAHMILVGHQNRINKKHTCHTIRNQRQQHKHNNGSLGHLLVDYVCGNRQFLSTLPSYSRYRYPFPMHFGLWISIGDNAISLQFYYYSTTSDQVERLLLPFLFSESLRFVAIDSSFRRFPATVATVTLFRFISACGFRQVTTQALYTFIINLIPATKSNDSYYLFSFPIHFGLWQSIVRSDTTQIQQIPIPFSDTQWCVHFAG